MKTLHITVENKIATYHDRDGVIVCNNTDYMIEFAFDSEWDNHLNKTARFIWNGTYEDVVFTGNTVAVPVIRNALSVTVGVFSGDLKTTTPATIECKKSILCEDGAPSDPGEDVYNQIIDLLNSAGGTGSGKDGVSPTVVVSQLTNGCLISITDANGTQSAFIKNGVDGASGNDGADGNDGVSPTIAVKPISGGNRIEITDANGTNSFNVMDGTDATTSELEREIDEIKQSIEDQKGTVIVEVGYDAETDTATADKSASEIFALVQDGASVVAVVNGENRYPYKRATLNAEGVVASVEFSFTEVGEQKDNVTTYGITIDEYKDGTIWFNEYESAELESKVSTLEQQMANLLYTAISITSFGHNAGTKEYGQTVSTVTLSWAINKTPTALTLDGVALDVSVRSKALTGLSITKDSNTTWKLVATDERGATSTKTTTISFANGIYYGAKAAPASYNSVFVLGLTKSLQNSKLSSVTVTAGAGEYIFYCLPKRMGTCAFNVGGFDGGFELIATIPFTNASGYTEDYHIYKSVEANLGKTTVRIS